MGVLGERLVRSFAAVSEDDGRSVTLHLFVDIVDVGTRGNPDETMDGTRSLRDDAGQPINYVSQGLYEDHDTGERFSSDAPDAP